MKQRFDLHGLAAATGIALAAVAAPALAADVTITPPAGGGVVVNGPVAMPGVPGSAQQTANVVCIAAGGALGPCPSTYGAAGPTGATGAIGSTGPTGATGVAGPSGPTGQREWLAHPVPPGQREWLAHRVPPGQRELPAPPVLPAQRG